MTKVKRIIQKVVKLFQKPKVNRRIRSRKELLKLLK